MYCTTLYKNYSINCVCSVCIFAAHQWCSSIQYYPVCRLQYAVLPSMQYYPVCSIAQYGALSSMQHTQNAGRSMQYYPVCSIPSVQYYPVCRLQYAVLPSMKYFTQYAVLPGMQVAECFDLPCLPVASFVLFTAQRGRGGSISSLLYGRAAR